MVVERIFASAPILFIPIQFIPDKGFTFLPLLFPQVVWLCSLNHRQSPKETSRNIS